MTAKPGTTMDAPIAGPAGDGPALALGYRRLIWRRALWLALLFSALLASVIANVMSGPAELGVWQVIGGILDPGSLPTAQRVILWDVRLPYALMAVMVGAALGLSGAEMQTVLNNALASPSTLGVMHAATLGASIAIVLKFDAVYLPENFIVPVCAFAGAMAAVALIQFLARLYGATVDSVILFGIATVFAIDALISLVQFIADYNSLQQIVFWTMGSLSRANWEKLGIVAAVFAICLPISMGRVWQMTALRGGEEQARSFGLAVGRLRKWVLFRVSILTAVAISFTGIIAFVGLVGPHIARLAVGEDHRFFLPASALSGAFILSGASLVAKTLVPGILIPDGIVTALIGIPLFLGLLVTQRRRG